MTEYYIPVYVTRADGLTAKFYLPEDVEDFWYSVAKMYPKSYDLMDESMVVVGGLHPWDVWFTVKEDNELALWLNEVEAVA